MRKILLASFAGLICFCTSCNDKTSVAGEAKDNSKAQKNLEASRAISKAFETGDVSMIDSVVAEDFVDHTDRGDKNRDSLKAMIIMVHKDFKDQKMEVIKEMADDDHVFTLMHFSGTSTGAMGMPVGPYDMHGLQVVKFRDGKAVEHWEYVQPAEMMKMMGQMPPMAKDTTKNK